MAAYLLVNNHRTFGDWYEDLLGAAAICRRDDADLHVTGEIDRPYKSALLDLFDVSAFAPASGLTMDVFDVAWGGTHHARPRLAEIADPVRILTHHDVRRERIIENEPHIPRHEVTWPNVHGDYVLLHWRAADGLYRYRNADPERDISDEYAREVVQSLLDAGFRLVRYGHEGTPPLAIDSDRYVEVFSDDPREIIRLTGHAKAFVEISPSGPAALALGFRVPLIRMNMREEYTLPFGGEIVLQHIDFLSGERVSRARATELGLRFEKLSPDEAATAAIEFLGRAHL